ncbi:MAG TPA: hypothetical protein VES93_16250 [Ornithinibacter sp.]|nr:hypothetical protein [Ornithinibacter sp.]
MALHCAATLVLVPVGTAPDDAAAVGAVVVGPLAPGADLVEELQCLADLHRGERVVVPVVPEQLHAVLEHLGRAARSGDEGAPEPVWLEVGDDGWALVPRLGVTRQVRASLE